MQKDQELLSREWLELKSLLRGLRCSPSVFAVNRPLDAMTLILIQAIEGRMDASSGYIP